MGNTPEDRGPDSERVVRVDFTNPIHQGILKNKEANSNVSFKKTKEGYVNMHMPVKKGMEAEPQKSTKYPSTKTITEPYKYVEEKKASAPKKEAKKLPSDYYEKAHTKEQMRREVDARRNAAILARKKAAGK